MTTEAERLDEAIREALDVLTGSSGPPYLDWKKVELAISVLNKALQVESDIRVTNTAAPSGVDEFTEEELA